MKLFSNSRLMWFIAVGCLAAGLVVLAVLQYRWSAEVKDAASQRMQVNLQSSIMRLREDLHRELTSVCGELQTDELQGDEQRRRDLADRYLRWRQIAVHPSLVSNLYIAERQPSGSIALQKLDSKTAQFQPAQWPDKFVRLKSMMSKVDHFARTVIDGPPPRHAPQDTFHFAVRLRLSPPWMFDQASAVMVHPVLRIPPRAKPSPQPPAGWVIVELNESYIRDTILPSLAQHYFSGPDGFSYNVAVLGSDREALYASDANFWRSPNLKPDARANLFGPVFSPEGDKAQGGPVPGPPQEFFEARPARALENARAMLRPLRYGPEQRDWEIVVKHHRGSLEAAVTAMQRRNLAVSFGILGALAITVALIVITTQRAAKLARLQMDFVTGVSHELRTPLAVISSAAENIVDGVVDERKQLVRYGSLIKDQAQQLRSLVDQVLLFASSRHEQRRPVLQPTDVGEVIDSVLASNFTDSAMRDFEVLKNIESGLPCALADRTLLCHCLQNLVSNAIKYGGERRWLRVAAINYVMPDGRPGICITVEDRGIGIAASDLKHIFEPFYRSSIVTSAQIHGTGLGLSIARSIAESMNGTLTVRSEEGKGSAFILCLRAAEGAPLTAAAQNG